MGHHHPSHHIKTITHHILRSPLSFPPSSLPHYTPLLPAWGIRKNKQNNDNQHNTNTQRPIFCKKSTQRMGHHHTFYIDVVPDN